MSLLRDDLLKALPYARRYARALSGSQPTGDELVASSLRELLGDTAPSLPPGPSPSAAQARTLLYRSVTQAFDAHLAAGSVVLPHATGALGLRQRQLLLLTALEEVPMESAAWILGLTQADAAIQLREARGHLRSAAATNVLIIEDETIIAMDIEELVQSCGHNVVGVAASEADAFEIATRTKPGLILADINLGQGGDGKDAVARILEHHQAPVIFVTAYPERLLTGDRTEPAFVITKPFEPLTLAIATYQAVTGGIPLI